MTRAILIIQIFLAILSLCPNSFLSQETSAWLYNQAMEIDPQRANAVAEQVYLNDISLEDGNVKLLSMIIHSLF